MSADESPLAAHAASPAELQERLSAERAGAPFLVLRDGEGRQRLLRLDGDRLSVGRAESNGVPLPWDTEVSRLHAELERIAGEWTVIDDGLSRNGTYVNGTRISGRARLRDGDVIRIGRTTLGYRRPDAEETVERTVVAGEPVALADLPPTQRQVLVALARPYKQRRVRDARDQPGDRRASCTSASTRSRRTCARCFRSSGSSRCPRTRSARGWWPRRSSAAGHPARPLGPTPGQPTSTR